MRDFKIVGKTLDKQLIEQLDYHSLLNFQTASLSLFSSGFYKG